MNIEYTATAIHGMDGRSAMARLLTTCDHCKGTLEVVRWSVGRGVGTAMQPHWNCVTKMYRAPDEPIDAWTRRVLKEYVESERSSTLKDDGYEYTTGGIGWQAKTHVLSTGGNGMMMSYMLLSEFLDDTYESELSSSEKYVITHPHSFHHLISLKYGDIGYMPMVGWTEYGWQFVTESGHKLWFVADKYIPDNGKAYIMDPECLGTMSIEGVEASICPLLKDERAFGVIRFE